MFREKTQSVDVEVESKGSIAHVNKLVNTILRTKTLSMSRFEMVNVMKLVPLQWVMQFNQ